MRVRVDEPRQQHVARQRDVLARREFAIRVGRRDERDDAPGVDEQRVIRQRAGGLDRHDPAGVEAEVAGPHAASVTRKREGRKKAPRARGFFRGGGVIA